MTVMILERVTPSLRGELSRWLIELKAGIFVGRVSGMVRDRLWQRCLDRIADGTLYQIWRTNNEQGFDIRWHNATERIPFNAEGIWLIMRPFEPKKGGVRNNSRMFFDNQLNLAYEYITEPHQFGVLIKRRYTDIDAELMEDPWDDISPLNH
ncbi:MAG: type I-E CRISPR-associated endoribonuclease Cas2e [Candidatus Kapaibacterium sp.]